MATDDKLLFFLEELLQKIKSNTLQKDKRIELIDFYMKFNRPDGVEDLGDNDVLKFLCMGWYIYNEIEKNNHPDTIDH